MASSYWSSQEVLNMIGLNNQQSINMQSFLENMSNAMEKVTNIMAFTMEMHANAP